MIKLVISGGQSGSDQAGWRAAHKLHIPTKGWMPLHFMTENGPRPEYALLYNAREHQSSDYRERTILNVHEADVTLWLGKTDTPGFKCTRKACGDEWRDFVVVRPDENTTPKSIAHILSILNCEVLNVAGNRESSFPGIGERAEKFLVRVFRSM